MSFAAIWTMLRGALSGFVRPALTAVWSNPKKAAIAVVLLSLPVLGALADRALFRGDSSPAVRTDTVWSERTLVKRDTVRKTVPEQVTVLRRDTVVRYRDTTINIPDPLAGGFRVARPEPIRIDGRTVTYTAYSPGPGRWTQQTYEVPEDRFSASVGLTALSGPIIGAGPTLGVRYRDWRFTAGYLTTTAGPVYLGGLHYVF